MDCRVVENMKELCRTYCPDDWRTFTQGLRSSGEDGEEEEEEEEEEEVAETKAVGVGGQANVTLKEIH